MRPLVRRVHATLDQAFGFHRLERHRDVSLGHQQAFGQFLLADSLACSKTEQNLKTRKVQVVLARYSRMRVRERPNDPDHRQHGGMAWIVLVVPA
jgi:hypothetical protein